MTIQEIKDSLLSNALFKISLGSKELFHSNFIQGILDINDAFGKEFTRAFLKNLGIEVNPDWQIRSNREKGNIDIILELFQPGSSESEEDTIFKTIVIENKVKSLPDREQLIRYKENYPKKGKPTFYLLSLIEPNFDFKKISWSHISYSDLSVHIIKAYISTCVSHGKTKFGFRISFDDLLNEYCEFTETLSRLGDYIKTIPEEPYNFYDGIYLGVDFKRIRIHDLILKLKYQQIGGLIRERLLTKKIKCESIEDKKGKFVPEDNIVYLNSGFTRSHGLFDIKIFLGNIKFEEYLVPHFLVVQLQGSQLRYCSYLLKRKVPETTVQVIHKEVIKGLSENWFNNTILGLELDRKGEGSGKKNDKVGYCKFGNEFYFRYDIITNKEQLLTICDILDYFEKLIDFILTNRTELKYSINTLSLYKYE